MNYFEILLLIILIAIVALCIYSVSNTNRKLQRLRRRYDFLLRGRGELNLEELILEFGEELDGQIVRQEEVSTLLAHMDSRLQKAEGHQESLVDQRNSAMEDKVFQVMDQVNQDLTSAMKRLDETVYARMDTVEMSAKKNLEDGLKNLDSKLTKFSDSISTKMRKHEEENYVQFDGVRKTIDGNDKKMAQVVDANDKKVVQLVDANDKKQKQSLSETEARLRSELNQQVNEIRDQLAGTMQKLYLYRYNAFEDLTGEQSFSFALLDEHHNGLIVTSIYSRRGSSIFAKNIENGSPIQGLSPEEKTALQRALDSE